MKYVSQVENKVTNIFALDEGIILEFSTVHMPTFAEIIEKASYQAMEAENRKIKSKGSLIITQAFHMSVSTASHTTSSDPFCLKEMNVTLAGSIKT